MDGWIQVEWDTDPGRQEVQSITTGTYLGANEIQVISTTAQRVDAVQTVQTTATTVYEVQVRVSMGHNLDGWRIRINRMAVMLATRRGIHRWLFVVLDVCHADHYHLLYQWVQYGRVFLCFARYLGYRRKLPEVRWVNEYML